MKLHHRTKWTESMLIDEARKYRTKREFNKYSSGAVKAATRMGILDEVCAHMKQSNEKWSAFEVAKEAQKYTSVKDFRLGSSVAYRKAKKLGTLNYITYHMTK